MRREKLSRHSSLSSRWIIGEEEGLWIKAFIGVQGVPKQVSQGDF
jgi:hypothetical protein